MDWKHGGIWKKYYGQYGWNELLKFKLYEYGSYE